MAAAVDVVAGWPALLVATAASAATAGAVLWLARRGRYPLLDAPHAAYKRQAAPVPLAGGLCLLLACLGLLLPDGYGRGVLGDPWLVAGFLVALAVGLEDDRRKARGSGLPWLPKLAGQVAAATCAGLAGRTLCSPPLAIAWLVLCMNAWNFLDNCDGVAAATVIGATAPWAALEGGPFVVVPLGAMCGFILFNWPRARIFLGDGGSQGIGLLLGCASLYLLTYSPATSLAPHALALADLLQVVAVRVGLGLAPWHGDRRHLAHRLQRLVPVRFVAPCFLLGQGFVSWLVAFGVPGRE